MQKVLFFLFFLCTTIIVKAQLVYPYSDIKLEKPGDYIATEPMALSAASFLLTTPFAANNQDRISALKFMVNWMQGDKKYDFYLKGMVADIREDNDLAGLFLAAMVSYTLKNKTVAVNPITVDLNAAKIIIAYCDDPKNNFKLKKKYRKMLEKNEATK